MIGSTGGRRAFLALLFAGLLAPAASAEVLFESSWNAATGNSNTALSDGGRWTVSNNGDADQLTIIPNGVGGNNALRVKMEGLADPHVRKESGVGPRNTSDWYFRLYVKVLDCNTSNLHGIQTPPPSDHLFVGVRNTTSTHWRPYMFPSSRGALHDEFSGPSNVLARNRWYRVEQHWALSSPNSSNSPVTIQVRFYDDAGNLVMDESDFDDEQGGGTLAAFNSRGSLRANASLDGWFMGNNGPAAAGGTNCNLYDISAFATSNSGWLGPVAGEPVPPGGGGGGTPPPPPPPPPDDPPDPPSSATAPVLQTVTPVDSSTAQIQWTQSAPNPDNFDVVVDGVDTNETNRTSNGSVRQATIGGLSPAGGQHCFAVQARHVSTGELPISNTVCADFTGSAPPAALGQPGRPQLVQ